MYYVEYNAVMNRQNIRVGRLYLTCIFILAALVRLIVVIQFAETAVGYSEGSLIGSHLAEGRGFVFDFYRSRPETPLQSFIPPLYPYFVSIALKIAPEKGITLLHILQAFMSSLATLFVYGIGRKLTNNQLTGFLCGLAFALYPIYVISVGIPQSLTVANFVSVVVIFLTLHLRDTDYSYGIAAALGFTLGLQLLIRPAMVGYLPILFIWLWLMSKWEQRKAALWSWVIVAGVSMLTIMPWQIRNYQRHNSFVFVASNGGFNLWVGNNPFTTGSGLEVDAVRLAAYRGEAFESGAQAIIPVLSPYQMPLEMDEVAELSEVQLDRELRTAALKFIRENPGETLRLAIRKMVSFALFRPNIGAAYDQASWITYYKPLYITVLLVASGGLLLARQEWRKYSLFLMVAAYCLLVYTVFHVQTRYRWEIEYMLLILCALPATKLVETVKDRLGFASPSR